MIPLPAPPSARIAVPSSVRLSLRAPSRLAFQTIENRPAEPGAVRPKAPGLYQTAGLRVNAAGPRSAGAQAVEVIGQGKPAALEPAEVLVPDQSEVPQP